MGGFMNIRFPNGDDTEGSITPSETPKSHVEAKSRDIIEKIFTQDNISFLDRTFNVKFDPERFGSREVMEEFYAAVGSLPLPKEFEKGSFPVAEKLTPKEKRLLNDLVSALPDRISSKGKKEIREMIEKSLRALAANRDRFLLHDYLDKLPKHQNEWNGHYLRPQDFGFSKNEACHIQVNPDGNIFLTIKHDELNLGQGANKKVFTGLNLNDQIYVAVGSIDVRDEVSQASDIYDVKNEVEHIQRYLGEKAAFVKVYERTETKVGKFDLEYEKQSKKAKVYMPLANLGDVNSALKKHDFTFEQKCHLMTEISKWIQLFHGSGYVYLDMKPANLLLSRTDSGDFKIKITDLGTMLPSNEFDKRGTPAFFPPEMNRGRKGWSDNKAVDVFELGITLFHIYKTGPLVEHPKIRKGDEETEFYFFPESMGHLHNVEYSRAYFKYPDSDEAEVRNPENYTPRWKAERGRLESMVEGCKRDLLLLISDMTHPEPEKRPMIDDVVARLARIS